MCECFALNVGLPCPKMQRFVRNAQRPFKQRLRLHHRRRQSTSPNPAATSAWLNVPPASAQSTPQYPPQASHISNISLAKDGWKRHRQHGPGNRCHSCCVSHSLPEFQLSFWDIFRRSKIRKNMGRLQGDGMAIDRADPGLYQRSGHSSSFRLLRPSLFLTCCAPEFQRMRLQPPPPCAPSILLKSPTQPVIQTMAMHLT